MTILYFFAGVGTRLLSFAAAILFARLMTPADFGDYVLTLNNSLLWAMLSNYWLVTSAFRFLAMKNGQDAARVVSTLLAGLCFSLLLAAVLGIASIAASFAPIRPALLPTAVVITVLSMVADVSGACFTAAADPKAYFNLTMRRAIVGFPASLALIVTGFGVFGAMAGQILGLIAGLFEPRVIALWGQARWHLADRALLKRIFFYGATGSLAFSLYMVIHVINRNFIALHLGGATAGRFALAFDTFYAPIGMIGSAMSLGRMASMHAGAQESVGTGLRQVASYIEKVLLFAVPYAAGGWMLAPRLASLAFGKDIGAEVSSYAAIAAVHGAVMTLVSALLLGILVLDRRFPLILALAAIICANSVALVVQGSAATVHSFAMATFAAMGLSLIGLGIWLILVDGLRLRWCFLVLPATGAALMAAAISWTSFEGHIGAALSVLIGAGVYAIWCEVTGLWNIRILVAARMPRMH
ncbi:hypothetical protein [Methylocystis sp.]|uniref:hypothetical protein n=1 Tax=Methylocystis sp. TaxID=1911079 RepID=UPI003DA394A0